MFTYFFINLFNEIALTPLYTNTLVVVFLLLPVISFNNYTPTRINQKLALSSAPLKCIFFCKL